MAGLIGPHDVQPTPRDDGRVPVADRDGGDVGPGVELEGCGGQDRPKSAQPELPVRVAAEEVALAPGNEGAVPAAQGDRSDLRAVGGLQKLRGVARGGVAEAQHALSVEPRDVGLRHSPGRRICLRQEQRVE